MANNGSKVGCWIAISVLGLLLIGSFLTNIGLTAALFSGPSGSSGDFPVDQQPDYEEIWSEGYGETKAVRIELSGVIMRGQRGRLLGNEPDMVESVLGQIRAATLDCEVKAIILEVSSPGGAVTPSDEIYAELQAFKRADEERRIMVFIRDLGASGAYYAAMAGDFIMAEPTSIVGSVGVIMHTINMKALSDKIGLSSVTIASGANKDMLNPLKEVNPRHVELLQTLVNGMQDRFASIVENSRGLESRALLDGRVFSADQAVQLGLIDRVGYWDDAVKKLSELLGEDDLYIVRYRKERSFFDSLMGVKVPDLPNLDAVASPRFLYLWKP